MERIRCVLLLSLCFAVPPLHSEGLSDWQAKKPPRLRIAASPYPNFLLDVLPSDSDMGDHLYRVKIDTLGMGPSSERSRGHFYTRRGGFLDLAHIRRAIDLAGYVHYRVRHCLEEGKTHFSFESIDKTTYHCHITYPSFWVKLAPGKRKQLIAELSIRAAEVAAVDFSNWREILTWYGFHNVPGMPEKSSAFSYEDLYSHSVGSTVAVRALSTTGVPFDQAVTKELDRELEALEVVSRELCLRAMSLVENHWWSKKDVLKRNLDTGDDNGWIEPWLVRNLEVGRSPRPKLYASPSREFSNIAGYRCRDIIVFACEPHMRRTDSVHAVLASGEKCVLPARDYPTIITRIRGEVLTELGPNADRPYP